VWCTLSSSSRCACADRADGTLPTHDSASIYMIVLSPPHAHIHLQLHAVFQTTTLLSHCEDRIGTGPPRARTEVVYVDLNFQYGLHTHERWADDLHPHSVHAVAILRRGTDSEPSTNPRSAFTGKQTPENDPPSQSSLQPQLTCQFPLITCQVSHYRGTSPIRKRPTP